MISSKSSKKPQHIQLILRIQYLHLKAMVRDLSSTGTLGTRLQAFLLFQAIDLMLMCQTLDHFWLEFWFAVMSSTIHSHWIMTTDTAHSTPTSRVIARVHHEPFEMFIVGIALDLLGLFFRNVTMNDTAEVLTSITFNNDHL